MSGSRKKGKNRRGNWNNLGCEKQKIAGNGVKGSGCRFAL